MRDIQLEEPPALTVPGTLAHHVPRLWVIAGLAVSSWGALALAAWVVAGLWGFVCRMSGLG